MKGFLIAAALTAFLVPATSARGVNLSLTGLRHAKFKGSALSPDHASAAIMVADELALYFAGDPTCSGGDEVELLISSTLGSTGRILLPCAGWTSRNWSFQYRDRSASVGGVKKVSFGYGKLKIQMKGSSYSAIAGPAEFVEISFRVGAMVLCGRATEFSRNDVSMVLALGPSSKCFDPIQAPTETPTPTETATQTPTPTLVPPSATMTPTWTDTATWTPTATPTLTATDTPTATASPTVTESPTRTPTATRTPTLTRTPTPSPTVTPEPVFAVNITAYRPQSEGYGSPLPRLAVGESEEESPGAGIRINGDDDNANGVADFSDTVVDHENDLIEVVLNVDPSNPPSGYEYVLVRTNPHLKVWSSAAKGTPILGANDEAVGAFGGPTATLWVECDAAGSGSLRLAVRRTADGATKASDQVGFYAFSSIVIALGGENQSPSNPINSGHGVFVIAGNLYALGYDVHMYDEDNVGSSGSGSVYNEVVSAIVQRDVHVVSIYGYSHGGGSTHDLAERLNNNRGSIGTFTLPYTAYIDGVENDSDIDLEWESRLPPTTQYHVNYYQRNFIPMGTSVSGANVNINLSSSGVQHGEIDDRSDVRSGVQQALVQHVPR